MGDVNQTTFGSDYVAYDGEFGKYSPGMFLIVKVIEGFCDGNREGVARIDFATGHAQYKQVLANQEWQEDSVYIFAPSAKGISLNLVRSLVCAIDQAAKKMLARTNLLQRIKKRWRAAARPKEATHD
jgi:CelD/BcsL family acetyltransferase involved in cellulose biosynthesis